VNETKVFLLYLPFHIIMARLPCEKVEVTIVL
jgi:hypothetical protein